jgi:hypothetical protein
MINLNLGTVPTETLLTSVVLALMLIWAFHRFAREHYKRIGAEEGRVGAWKDAYEKGKKKGKQDAEYEDFREAFTALEGKVDDWFARQDRRLINIDAEIKKVLALGGTVERHNIEIQHLKTRLRNVELTLAVTGSGENGDK